MRRIVLVPLLALAGAAGLPAAAPAASTTYDASATQETRPRDYASGLEIATRG